MTQQNQKPQNGITEGVIWKNLLLYFFPILLGTFFQQMYNTVDAIVVGKYVGKVALAAVGTTSATLINLLVGFFVGISSGATVILAQHFGAKRDEDVYRTVHTASALALVIGAGLMVAGYFLAPTVLRWMNTAEEVLPQSILYLRIYFLGMIPSLVYNIGSGLLRAVGDSRRPLIFLIVACLSNIVLDLLFVVGFDMGVSGAALATTLSQAISAVLVVLCMTRTRESYRLFPSKIRFYPGLLGAIVRIGLPSGFQSMMYSVSNTIIVSVLNTFGTNAMAAQTAYSKIDGLFWMVNNAFGAAVCTFVGQNFGAGRIDRVKASVRICLLMGGIGTLLITAVDLLFGRTLLSMFTDDPEVLQLAVSVMNMIVPFYFTYLGVEILSGALRGTGDTLIPTILTLSGICVFRLIWIQIVVSRYHDIQHLMMCYPISWGLTSILFIIYYYCGHWLQRSQKRLDRLKRSSDI